MRIRSSYAALKDWARRDEPLGQAVVMLLGAVLFVIAQQIAIAADGATGAALVAVGVPTIVLAIVALTIFFVGLTNLTRLAWEIITS